MASRITAPWTATAAIPPGRGRGEASFQPRTEPDLARFREQGMYNRFTEQVRENAELLRSLLAS